MITHFYSDPHFGHANIIQYAQRPFASVDEMDGELILRYCSTVGPDDVVLWCGDVTFHDPFFFRSAILNKLPGRKILVRGNHDQTLRRCLDMGFELVFDSLHLEIGGHKVTVSHYPPAGGPDSRHLERRPPKPGPGEFVIHGHTHEPAARVGRRIHVGVDAWDFRPVAISRIADLIRSPQR